MVNTNPKLSLPTDLPYKKRQRPFSPNTALQQATIRYNEAVRKQYNDVQFERRYENGCISQNELISVNTIDITKTVKCELFAEMCNLNPLPVSLRQRKSKRFDVCPVASTTGSDGISCSNAAHHHHQHHNHNTSVCGTQPVSPTCGNNPNQNSTSFDCNDMEMFPHLSASTNSPQDKSNSVSFAAKGMNKPSSSGSLEAQAIHQYHPAIDSAHDMIFGNVMGINYGNYVHDHLWTPPPPPPPEYSQNIMSSQINNCQFNTPAQHQSQQTQQHFLPIPHPPNNMCLANKSAAYNLPPTRIDSSTNTPPSSHVSFDHDRLSGGTSGPNHHISGAHTPISSSGLSSSTGGSNRRSTSVPRPRAGGTRKETLKQAAIRCGIIKGNQTVPAIHKRSQCWVPLVDLNPVLSDPVVSVVEILHPRTLIPTCSSEALVEVCKSKSKQNMSGSTSIIPKNEKCSSSGKCETGVDRRSCEDGRGLTEIQSVSDFKIIEGVSSTPSF